VPDGKGAPLKITPSKEDFLLFPVASWGSAPPEDDFSKSKRTTCQRLPTTAARLT